MIEAKLMIDKSELQPPLQIGSAVPTIPLQARRMFNPQLRITA